MSFVKDKPLGIRHFGMKMLIDENLSAAKDDPPLYPLEIKE